VRGLEGMERMEGRSCSNMCNSDEGMIRSNGDTMHIHYEACYIPLIISKKSANAR